MLGEEALRGLGVGVGVAVDVGVDVDADSGVLGAGGGVPRPDAPVVVPRVVSVRVGLVPRGSINSRGCSDAS